MSGWVSPSAAAGKPGGRRLAHALARASVVVCVSGAAACVEQTGATPRPVVLEIGLALPPQGVAVFRDGLINETLLTTSADGRQLPRVLDAWEAADDGRSVKFHVRNGVKFHDGMAVDAPLVRRALLRLIEAKSLRADRIASIDAISPDELVIRLSEPDSLLLPSLGDVTLRHPQLPNVGTGPFRIAADAVAPEPPAPGAAAPDGRVTLHAFDHYHGGRPYIDEIVIKPYGTQRNAWAAMMRGDVDYLHEVSRDAVDFVEAESSVRVHSIPRPYYIALAFNVAHPILRKPEVRQALSRSVDRDAVVRIGMNGRGAPGTGAFWPKHWAYSTAVPTYTFNPDAARLQLNAAGFAQKTAAGGHPARFRFTCLTFADARFERVALVVQRQLFEVGVDMQIEAVPFRDLVERMKSGRFDAILMEFASGRTLDYPYYWWRSAATSQAFRTAYTAADRALDSLRSAYTDEAVRAAVSDAQRIMFEDPPAVFLAWQQNLRAVSTQFDVPVDPDRDLMATIARWRPSQAAAAAARP